MDHKQMDYLDKLEAKSIYILREAYASFDKLCMLWSIGKDSCCGWRAKPFSAMSPSLWSMWTPITRSPK